MAEGLGKEGSDQLRHFIEDGGVYIGTCAGAYLPLRSSMDLLNQFNFIDVKISNISRRLTEPERHSFEKYACSSYGCEFVYHVVREDVLLEWVNGHQRNGKKEIVAPLFGGPAMLPSSDIEPIAIYKGFTKKTRFLVEEEMAGKTLIGNIAVAKKSMGRGHLYIFGPHFEHPHYPSCNQFLSEIIGQDQNKRSGFPQKEAPGGPSNLIKGEPLKELLKEVKRGLSNARISASGMNDFSTRWLIGNKYYDPEKITVFINTVWKKLKRLESMKDVEVDKDRLFQCAEMSMAIAEKMKALGSEKKDQGKATLLASDLFLNLKALSSHFFALYFKAKRDPLYG